MGLRDEMLEQPSAAQRLRLCADGVRPDLRRANVAPGTVRRHDFEHGSLALAEPVLPVLAVAPNGTELEAQVALLARLKGTTARACW